MTTLQGPITGWKCFDKNLKCRGYAFEVGGTYAVEGPLRMCAHGFHFHTCGGDLFKYYSNDVGTRVCEIIAHDEVETDGDKSVCRRIEIVRELTYNEICMVYGYGYGSGSGSGYGSGSGSGYGYGDGYGSGSGYGDGSGSGSGYGSGYGDGYGYGYGSGYGSGDGSGYGSGSGSGYGDGYGYGYGSGYGSGDGSGYGYGSGYGSGDYYLKLTAEGKISA